MEAKQGPLSRHEARKKRSFQGTIKVAKKKKVENVRFAAKSSAKRVQGKKDFFSAGLNSIASAQKFEMVLFYSLHSLMVSPGCNTGCIFFQSGLSLHPVICPESSQSENVNDITKRPV